MFSIIIDGDGCPVIRIVEKIAKERNISVVIISDENHQLYSESSEVIRVASGMDSADFKILGKCKKDDLIVTQDYGLAAMVIGKGCYCINQNGKWLNKDNIDLLLMERHLNKKNRQSKGKKQIKGPRKRTYEDDINFEKSLKSLFEIIEKTSTTEIMEG